MVGSTGLFDVSTFYLDLQVRFNLVCDGLFDLRAVFNLDNWTARSARLEDEPFLKGGRMLRPYSLMDGNVL